MKSGTLSKELKVDNAALKFNSDQSMSLFIVVTSHIFNSVVGNKQTVAICRKIQSTVDKTLLNEGEGYVKIDCDIALYTMKTEFSLYTIGSKILEIN